MTRRRTLGSRVPFKGRICRGTRRQAPFEARHTQHYGPFIAAMIALCALACGDSEDFGLESFASVRLNMTDGVASDYSNLRVALAWANHEVSSQLQITDDHAWPGEHDSLVFDLSQHPTDDTLYDWGGRQGELSVGGLFAYEDIDDDAKFTFTTLGDDTFKDHVVGWSPGLRVVSAPAGIVETSQFAPGYSFYTTTYVDGQQSHAIEELSGNNIVLAVDTFGAPEARCFGLSPGVENVPTSVDTRPIDRPTQFGAFFDNYDGQPYITGIPECPFDFDERPSGWEGFEAICIAGQESLVTFRFAEHADEAIAAICGRQVSRCHFVLDKDRYPPDGLPPGVCQAANAESSGLSLAEAARGGERFEVRR